MIASQTLIGAANQWGPPWGPGWGPGPGFLFILIPLFWIAVVVLIVSLAGRRWRRAAAYRGYGGHPGAFGYGYGDQHGAEQTLAERFAQGDIDEVEYRARLEVLRANRQNGS